MQTTTNIGLKTYEANDPTDWLGEFNYNMNKIDTAVGDQNDAIDVIEQTANTAVSTANTASTTATDASTTATQALDVANSKPSINDTVAGATSTYSSNKIEELISGIEPGSEIDDTTTSTTKTWSSSKINTEVSTKASINDTTAGATTTYSSNKIDSLISGAGGDFPDYSNFSKVATTSTISNNSLRLTYTATEDCYLLARIWFTPTNSGAVLIAINTPSFVYTINFENHVYTNLESQIFKVKAGTSFDVTVFNVADTTGNHDLDIYKLPITN